MSHCRSLLLWSQSSFVKSSPLSSSLPLSFYTDVLRRIGIEDWIQRMNRGCCHFSYGSKHDDWQSEQACQGPGADFSIQWYLFTFKFKGFLGPDWDTYRLDWMNVSISVVYCSHVTWRRRRLLFDWITSSEWFKNVTRWSCRGDEHNKQRWKRPAIIASISVGPGQTI